MKWRKTMAGLLALVMTLQSIPALAAEPEKPQEEPAVKEEYLPEEEPREEPAVEEPHQVPELLAEGDMFYEKPYPEATYEIEYIEYEETVDGTLMINGAVGDVSGRLVLPSTARGKRITAIRKFAFHKCKSLTGSLLLPEYLTTIGEYAFFECSGLTGSLTIPDSVITIGECAFEESARWLFRIGIT